MDQINPQLQQILDNYAQQVGGKDTLAYTNTYNAISQTPYLIERMNQAVERGDLQMIEAIPLADAGAQFNSSTKTMQLSLHEISKNQVYTIPTLVSQIGHELHHAEYAKQEAQSYTRFGDELADIALKQPKGTQDYTAPISNKINSSAQDEAWGMLAGWNAYQSYHLAKNPDATLDEVRANMPYKTYFEERSVNHNGQKSSTLDSDLYLSPDQTIAPTEKNIQTLKENYFYQSADKARLGPKQNADYPSYYGSALIGSVCNYTADPYFEGKIQPQLNMQALNLNPEVVQSVGIPLKQEKCDYVDVSDPSNPTPKTFYRGTQAPAVETPAAEPFHQDPINKFAPNDRLTPHTPATDTQAKAITPADNSLEAFIKAAEAHSKTPEFAQHQAQVEAMANAINADRKAQEQAQAYQTMLEQQQQEQQAAAIRGPVMRMR